jgi:endonuclease/exonuclease/phosphatase family metal-dependent hydrolase
MLGDPPVLILKALPLITGFCFALAVAIVVLSELTADRTALGVAVAAVPPMLLIGVGAFLTIPVLLARPKWPAWVATGGILVAGVWLGQPAFPRPKDGGLQPVKVVSLNMQHGLGGLGAVAKYLGDEAPEVILLQEAGPVQNYPDPKTTHPDFLRLFKNFFVVTDGQDLLIASKYPFRNHRVDDLPEPRGKADKRILVAEIIHPSGDICAATVHLSPRQTGFAELAEVRTAQYQTCKRFFQKRPRVILGGDFNGPPIGPNHRDLSTVATDAWARAGLGFGLTHNRRIDQIWVKGLNPYRAEVGPNNISDHQPVIAWMR